MRFISVDRNLPKMLAVKLLSPVWPGVIWSPISPVTVAEIDEPPLPGPRFARVRNLQCGICATDLSFLHVEADPAIGPAALPGNDRFFLGHEVVGRITEVGSQVSRFELGDRVVMESRFAGPSCLTLEIEPLCRYCADGQVRLCESRYGADGPRGVGGGWGDGFTAHEEELWPVPESLTDDQAALIEPMSVALHAVLLRPPGPDDHVLVVGAGIIGLLTARAAKIVQPECHLSVMARYEHQAAAAARMGADEVIRDEDPYEAAARITSGSVYRAPMNRGMLVGGYEVIYDCVGSQTTISDSLRWARAAGSIVLVGISLKEMKVDLTPTWYQEVSLIGSHTFGVEDWRGERKHTFDWVIEMMEEGLIDPAGMITHRYPLNEYRQAIATAEDKSSGAIKVMFEIDQR